VIAATIDYSHAHHDTQGGWHDAADWDRRSDHLTCVLDLLNAYALAPQKFRDGQLNLPESGNGVPDILDEAEYGLRIWLKSQNAAGGISGAVETWTHPPMDSTDYHYAFAQRTRWDSLLYAGAAAQFAQLVAPFDEALATRYAESALRAFDFGVSAQNSFGKVSIQAKAQRGRGEGYLIDMDDSEAQLAPYELHARLRLFLLTGQASYLENVETLAKTGPKPFEHPLGERGFALWLYFPLFDSALEGLISQSVINEMKLWIIGRCVEIASWSREQPYRQTWPGKQDYWMAWGATSFYNQAKLLLIAEYLSGKQGFRELALHNCNFMLGANPMGMSWTTGLGKCYPVDIQHSVSRYDGIADPVPGITIYGLTGHICAPLRQEVWNIADRNGHGVSFMKEDNQNLPLWRRWACHPGLNTGQCEFTIHETVSASLFVSALLLPDDWMPTQELRNHKPRPIDELHGYWYLP
jgi:endoglucanase